MSHGLQCHARKLARQAERDALKMSLSTITDRKRFIVIDQDLNTVGEFDKRRNAKAFAAGLQSVGTSATVIHMPQIVDVFDAHPPSSDDSQGDQIAERIF